MVCSSDTVLGRRVSTGPGRACPIGVNLRARLHRSASRQRPCHLATDGVVAKERGATISHLQLAVRLTKA